MPPRSGASGSLSPVSPSISGGEAIGIPDSLRASLTLATERVELADLLSLLPAETAAKGASDFEGSGPLSVEGELHVAPGGPPTFRVAARLGGIDVRNKKFSESITGLKGRIEATESAVRLEEIAGSIGGRPFRVNGSVESFADPAVDLAVKADLDLAALGRAGLLPEGTTLSGGLSADVRARGRVADPNGVGLDGSVKIVTARLALADPPVEAANASGEIALSGRSAEIKNLRFDLNGSPTTLTGKVTDPLGDLRATANLVTRKIDFNAFLPSAPEGEGGSPSPGTAADPPPIVLPPLPPITLAATVKADTVITGVNVLTGAEATLDVKNGEGTIRIRMARGLFGGVAVKEAVGDLRVEGGTLSGDLTAKEALAYRVPLTSIRGKIALTPEGVVNLDGVTANVWEGTVAGDASVRLNEPGGATYRFAARAENVEANDFLTNLTPAKDILYGRFRLESAWEGRGLTEKELLASLSANGTMKAAEGRIRNLTALDRAADLLGMKEMGQIEFREFWSKFAVDKGRVRFDDLLVRGKNADWNAAGSVGFDGTLDYALTITLSEANSAAYRKKSALTSLFTDPSGRVVLDVKVGGTTDRPAITLDASKTASRAGIEGLDKVIDDIQKDENVQKAIGDLLGGKTPSLEGLLGGGSKKKTAPDTSKASGQK
ncbi:MAG: AsmA-like C-terminal region-containing protein [Candidatus Eisenbacteria bacterium]